MDFFRHDVNFDWMGKTKYFVALSLTLLLVGAASWIHKATPNANEVVIYLPQRGQGNEALDAGKAAILNALHATLGSGEAGKQDFNEAGADTIADVLTRKDPLGLG